MYNIIRLYKLLGLWKRKLCQGNHVITVTMIVLEKGKKISLHSGQVAHQAGVYPGFCLSLRVKSLAQEHNTMSPARDRTRSARSRVEHANHETTARPTGYY